MGDARIDARELDEIEARANAATPGDWHVHTTPAADAACRADREEPGVCQGFMDVWDTDARFIAGARSDVVALVAEVRESASECEKLKAALRALVEACDKVVGIEPKIHEFIADELWAARALVGSVPPTAWSASPETLASLSPSVVGGSVPLPPGTSEK